MRYFVIHFLLFFVLSLLSGCATINPDQELRYETAIVHDYPEPERFGVYHKVKVGETLWRIAKIYDISINDLIRANNILDAAQIEKNQLIFIPGAYEVREVIIDSEDSANEFIWPVQGEVARYFNQPDGNSVTKGIDIQAKPGEKVVASRTGRVAFADWLSGYGYTVILNHNDGYYTVYAHNAKLLVELGQMVIKKTPLAYLGSENDVAYLHFQIRQNELEDNPLYYLP